MDLTAPQLDYVKNYIQQNPTHVNDVVQTLQSKGYTIPTSITGSLNQQQSNTAQQYHPFSQYQGGGVGDFVGSAITNIPSSAMNIYGNMASHPLQTAATIAGGLIGGGLGELIGPEGAVIGGLAGATIGGGLAQGKDPITALKGLVDYYKQRYGSFDQMVQTAANDPVGLALDFSMLADSVGAGMDQMKIGAMSQEDIAAAKEAGQAIPKTPGQKVQSAAGWINPISAPFKLLGTAFKPAEGTPTEVSAQRIGDLTGVDVKGSMTAGMKKGGFLPVVEAVASFLPGGGKMNEKIQTAVSSIDTAADNFGSLLTERVSQAEPVSGQTSYTDLAGEVANTIMEQKNNTKKLTYQFFGNVVKQNADVPVDPNQLNIPTEYDESGNPVNYTSLSDMMQGMTQDTKYTPGFRKTIAGLGKDLFGGGSEADQILKDVFGSDLSQITPQARAKVLEGAGVKNAESGITFGDLYKISQQMNNLFSKTRKGTSEFAGLTQLDQAIQETLGGALKEQKGPNGQDLFQEWTNLKGATQSAIKGVNDPLYKKVVSAFGGATPKTATFLEQVFGKNATPQTLNQWEQAMGEDNFQKMGFAYLMKKVQDSYVNAEGKPNGDMVNGTFDAKLFKKNIDSIPDERWNHILGNDGYQIVQWAKSNASDFQNIFNGIKVLDQYARGSRTTPTSVPLRILNRMLTGVGGSVTAGEFILGGVQRGFQLMISQALFARLMGSDLGQSILGNALGNTKISNTLNLIAKNTGLRASGIASQSLGNAQSTQQMKPLTGAQRQYVQQYLQENPQNQQQVEQWLSDNGYESF